MAIANHTTGLALVDRFESLHAAYVGLQVLAGEADTDSRHVAAVLDFLNQALSECLEDVRPRPSCLRLVDD